ncbi:laccase-14, partial [Nicotiana attenuata]
LLVFLGWTETFNIEVEPGKTYLLRLVNAAVGKILVFGIGKHKLTVVGINGWYTKPFTVVDYVKIGVQQSVDCILEANQKPDHYYMAATQYYSSHVNNVQYRNTTTTAVMKYRGDYVPSSPPLLPDLPSDYDKPSQHNQRISSTSVYYVPIIFIILILGAGACFAVWGRAQP